MDPQLPLRPALRRVRVGNIYPPRSPTYLQQSIPINLRPLSTSFDSELPLQIYPRLTKNLEFSHESSTSTAEFHSQTRLFSQCRW